MGVYNASFVTRIKITVVIGYTVSIFALVWFRGVKLCIYICVKSFFSSFLMRVTSCASLLRSAWLCLKVVSDRQQLLKWSRRVCNVACNESNWPFFFFFFFWGLKFSSSSLSASFWSYSPASRISSPGLCLFRVRRIYFVDRENKLGERTEIHSVQFQLYLHTTC